MVRSVVLSQGYESLVDDEDFDRVNDHKWAVAIRGTRRYGVNGRVGLLHRFILGLTRDDHFDTDHIDRDGLNNQRSNLRAATRSQNNANRVSKPGTSSRFKGVTWSKGKSLWRAQIKHDGKTFHLGYFRSEVEAALAYDIAAAEAFGSFARFNGSFR